MRFNDPHLDPTPITPWPVDLSRTIGLHEAGLVLGTGTPLVRFAKGEHHLAVEADRGRCLALLAVAFSGPISPDILRHVEAASAHWQRGDKALANLRLVFAGLPRLDEPGDAYRLQAAEYLLDEGISPHQLLTELGLDTSALELEKYDPDQPRVPAGNGPESGRWHHIWNNIVDWLEQPVPEYDQDTGIQVGTQSRGRAIAANPATVGVVGTAALLGGEGVAGAGAVAAPITIGDVDAALPEGMSPQAFGQIVGFSQGLAASSQASTEATAEVIAKLQEAGITRQAISLAQRFYAGHASANPANSSAIQRAALLANILKGYK